MDALAAYIPTDRCWALARQQTLPDRSRGAVLLADISGFTGLTEALVQALGPRRGIDELTRQLNQVYESLINRVYDYNGSVVGFSGDAIVCWFDGDPGERATACALAMQRAMGPLAVVRTPAGAVIALAIKVAVTAGPVRRFLVGDPHIQVMDVLAGATLDRMADIAALARRGEVLVGPEIVDHLDNRFEVAGWRSFAGGRCAVIAGPEAPPRPGSPGTNPSPLFQMPDLPEAQARAWLLPPVYERLKAGQGQFLAELRLGVALFMAFAGLDYDHDPAAGKKLDAFIRWVQNILALYEGYLLQLTTGDKGSYLYAVFGVPLAHDDDPSRAIAAALDLRSPPPGLGFVAGLKFGLSQGQVRAGAYGCSTRCTYGALGDEVNMAARLMEQAGPGQILASQRVVEGTRALYRFQSLPPLQVKGRSEPVPVYAVLGKGSPGQRSRQPGDPGSGSEVRPSRRPGPAAPPPSEWQTQPGPLVGREGELARITELIEMARSGAGQALQLEGDAGIGKSRLAAEAARLAERAGFKVAVAACHSTAQPITYHPWGQLLRALFGWFDEPVGGTDPAARLESTLKSVNADWLPRLPLLGDVLGWPVVDNATTTALSPQLRREALVALVIDMVQAQTRLQPLLLLVEDAHWLDEASLSLTLALTRVMAAAPILLILVHRPLEQPLLPGLSHLPGHHHLRLPELPSASMTALITHRLGGPISALALALIQAQAQGNPFFAEALVDALAEAGHLSRSEDGTWTLSAAVFEALRRGNCLTRDTDGNWSLVPAAPLAAVNLGLPDSIHGLILSRLDRLPQAHQLTLKVAAVIGVNFELDLLAHAHPLHPERAVLSEQVGFIQARGLVQPETSAPRLTYAFKHHLIQEVIYENLLEDQQRQLHGVVGQGLENLQPDQVEQLAYHYSRSGRRSKTLHYLGRAAHKAQREYANQTALNYYNQALVLEERREWRQGQVEVLHILGQREAERAALEQLAAHVEQPGGGETTLSPLLASSPAAFEMLYLWGQYYEAVSDYAQAQAAIEQALAAGRAQDHLAGEIRCLAQLGLIAFRQADYEQARGWYNQGLTLFRVDQSYPDEVIYAFIQAFNGLGMVYHEQGEYGQAQHCYQQALRLSRVSGDRPGEAATLFGLGATAFYQRHLTPAQRYFQQALEIQRTIGDRPGEATTLYNLAQVFTDGGDYGQARAYLAAALTTLQVTGNRWQEVYAWNDLGILYWELGDLAMAQDCLQQGLRLAQEIEAEEGQAYLMVNLGLVMRDERNLAAAEQFLTGGLALARQMENKRLAAFSLSYLSTVSLQAGQPVQAVEQAQAALILWHELGLHLRTSYDLATLALAYLLAGNQTEALNKANQALAILIEYGHEGAECPHRDYFIGYQVLSAAGQDEPAATALQAAYRLVINRANKIPDPALRQSFLKQVIINQEIVATYTQTQPRL